MNNSFQRNKSCQNKEDVKDMLGSLEPDRFGSWFILRVGALLLLFSIAAPAGQSGQSGLIRILTQDEANNPVPGVTVQVKRNNEIVSAIATNEKGEAVATNLGPGKYEIVVSKEGFETRTQHDVTLADAAIEVKITLVPKIALSDKVDISASASAAETPEQTASVATELEPAQVKN